MNKAKRNWIIIGAISIILIFTNPSKSDFVGFLTANEFQNDAGGRIAYFGIFSIYKANVGSYYKSPIRTYFGFFKNFICIHKEE